MRREPGETPSEHAGRLRRTGLGALSLDLLAADYGLVRYGARDLTAVEERRAIGRAARLQPAPGTGGAAAPPAEAGAERAPSGRRRRHARRGARRPGALSVG